MVMCAAAAGTLGGGPEDHQHGEEEEGLHAEGHGVPVQRLHHPGLHGRQQTQAGEE